MLEAFWIHNYSFRLISGFSSMFGPSGVNNDLRAGGLLVQSLIRQVLKLSESTMLRLYGHPPRRIISQPDSQTKPSLRWRHFGTKGRVIVWGKLRPDLSAELDMVRLLLAGTTKVLFKLSLPPFLSPTWRPTTLHTYFLSPSGSPIPALPKSFRTPVKLFHGRSGITLQSDPLFIHKYRSSWSGRGCTSDCSTIRSWPLLSHRHTACWNWGYVTS